MESDANPCEDLFACTLCGDCCRGFGGTYLTAADIDAIARYLGMPPERLLAAYTRPSGTRRLIAQAENGYCVFWDKVCTIHPVKPRMCRQWPFIPGILIDVNNWRAMASVCPGMNAGAANGRILDCVRRRLIDEATSA